MLSNFKLSSTPPLPHTFKWNGPHQNQNHLRFINCQRNFESVKINFVKNVFCSDSSLHKEQQSDDEEHKTLPADATMTAQRVQAMKNKGYV